MIGPVVLAFSGGLDASFLVSYLAERTGRPVITVTVDTGGSSEEAREDLPRRSRQLGAADRRTLDARTAFFQETLRFLIFGNVRRCHVYPLCVGAERTLQVRKVAEVAREARASAVAHGSTAAGNDHVRFEVAHRVLAPKVEVLAPVRDEGLTRALEVAFLRDQGHDVPGDRAAYSINRGLWGCTIGGRRETLDTIDPLPEEAWVLARGAFDAPRDPIEVRIEFRTGVPVRLDGRDMDPVVLIQALDDLAAPRGIGRGMHLGDTIFGLEGRVAFEAPAATVLIEAHRELEKLVLTGRQQRLKDQVATLYGDWVHEALALEPACRDAEALLEASQERVTGEVRMRLSLGRTEVLGVSSPFSLKAASSGTYGEAAGEWTGADAMGFARMLAIPAMIHARAGTSAGTAPTPDGGGGQAP